jgi:trigger factor
LPELSVETANVEIAGGNLPAAVDERLALARVGETFTVEAPPPEGASAELAVRRSPTRSPCARSPSDACRTSTTSSPRITADSETLDELRARVRTQLEQEGQRRVEAAVREGIVNQLLARESDRAADFARRTGRVEDMLRDFKIELLGRGLQLSSEEHEAEAREKLRPRAERDVGVGLLLDALSNQLGIEVTDDELAERIGRHVAAAGRHAEKLREHYAHDHARDAVRSDLRRAKALEKLVDSASEPNVAAAPA